MIRVADVRFGGLRLRTALRDRVRQRALAELQRADDEASTDLREDGADGSRRRLELSES